MRNFKLQRWCVGLTTLITAAVMASSAPAALTLPVNPRVPIPGVSCPAGTTQVNDTAARMDSLCALLYTTWVELGGQPSKPPEVTTVDTGPMQIPIDPTDDKKITDIIEQFEPSDDPTPDWGGKFEDCQTNPELTYCRVDPVIPPTIPDPFGPDILIDDPGGDSGSGPVGFHCDPRIWTSSDLVTQEQASPLDANGAVLDPIDVYVLNPDFPAQLLPQGDPDAEPPVPSLLSTRTGMAHVGSRDLPYWLDDPRGDAIVAYVDPAQQGCVSVPNTEPTKAAADALSPSAALPDSGGDGGITVSWSPIQQVLAMNGGAEVTAYEVRVIQDGVVVPGKSCTALFNTGDSCTVSGLTNGTLYTFQVRAINAVGASPWSVATDPPIAPVAAGRKAPIRYSRLPKSPLGLLAYSRSTPVYLAKAKAKKPSPPSAPLGVTVAQGTDLASTGVFPDNGVISIYWSAPKSPGSKPIKSYLVVVSQVGGAVVRCTTNVSTKMCTFDRLKKLPDKPLNISVQAINGVGKSPAAKPRRPFTFVVDCSDYMAQPAKCLFKIKVKTIMRMTGRRTEPAEVAGRKWQIACGHTPTVAYTKIRIKNPRFPAKEPSGSPTLMLGESFNAICRLVLKQVTVPLTKWQKGLAKKGYTVLSFKVMGLPSKGTRERPIPLPFALARVTTTLAQPVNSRFDKDGRPSSIANKPKLVAARWVAADSTGTVTWIGVIKKKGYYETAATWPFYKAGKTMLVYPKSKAKK